jgi:hypothetical protein
VILIRRIWDSLEPEGGQVKVSRIRELYKGKRNFDPALERESALSFDRFFEIFSRNLIEEKRRNGGVLPQDSLEMEASCLFCPYARDTGEAVS